MRREENSMSLSCVAYLAVCITYLGIHEDFHFGVLLKILFGNKL